MVSKIWSSNFGVSCAGKNSSWVNVLPNVGSFYHTQRIFNPNKTTESEFNVPISLLCEEFGIFLHQYTMECSTVSFEDMKFVQEFITSMACTYITEECRISVITSLLNSYFDMAVVTCNHVNVDGCIVHLINGITIAACIIEAKNEECSRNYDPVMQTLSYYTKFVSPHVTKAADKAKRCPCLILTICGPNLRVLGIINQRNSIVCECLVPTLTLAYITGSRITDSIVFCMTALKAALNNLAAYYKNPIISSDFPYFCSFQYNGKDTRIEYIERLERLVYSAKIQHDTNQEVEVIVKFTEMYGVNAHMYMASKQFSPKILHTGELKPKWKVIIMEKWNLTEFKANASNLKKLSDAIKELHNADFVHGDLRENNVFLTSDGNVAIIDFDWAGRKHEAKYPLWMNPYIEWPPGALPEQLITPDQDNWWLQKIV